MCGMHSATNFTSSFTATVTMLAPEFLNVYVVNRLLVYKPVILLLNWLACFQSKVVLFRNQAKWFENWPNGLSQLHESCTSLLDS